VIHINKYHAMSSTPSRSVSLSRHTLRQLKFVIPGGAITYYLGTHKVFWRMVTDMSWDGWARTAAVTSFALGLVIIALFLYILLVPWIRDIEPNYISWRESGILSSVIPVLTASIVMGWSLLSVTLSRWSSLGYFEGVIGASGLYALIFGLMGLIPAPKVHRT